MSMFFILRASIHGCPSGVTPALYVNGKLGADRTSARRKAPNHSRRLAAAVVVLEAKTATAKAAVVGVKAAKTKLPRIFPTKEFRTSFHPKDRPISPVSYDKN